MAISHRTKNSEGTGRFLRFGIRAECYDLPYPPDVSESSFSWLTSVYIHDSLLGTHPTALRFMPLNRRPECPMKAPLHHDLQRVFAREIWQSNLAESQPGNGKSTGLQD